jgi:hypothetical protein
MGSGYTDRLPATFSEHLLRCAVSLEAIGVSGLAWKRNDALRAVKEFAHHGCAILGGDILVESHGRIRHTYDSWYFNKGEEVPWERLVSDSRDYAISFIEKYSEPNQGSIYYSIVFEFFEEPNI